MYARCTVSTGVHVRASPTHQLTQDKRAHVGTTYGQSPANAAFHFRTNCFACALAHHTYIDLTHTHYKNKLLLNAAWERAHNRRNARAGAALRGTLKQRARKRTRKMCTIIIILLKFAYVCTRIFHIYTRWRRRRRRRRYGLGRAPPFLVVVHTWLLYATPYIVYFYVNYMRDLSANHACASTRKHRAANRENLQGRRPRRRHRRTGKTALLWPQQCARSRNILSGFYARAVAPFDVVDDEVGLGIWWVYCAQSRVYSKRVVVVSVRAQGNWGKHDGHTRRWQRDI